ncbi:hypothetical protein [Sphingobacterium sp.]|uniref:hypothetical protein n=1 Tax=Sphingobacterium sp. TaxID=341027 RepID=UPI0031D851B1
MVDLINNIILKYLTNHLYSIYTKDEIRILRNIERCYFNAFILSKKGEVRSAKLYNRHGDYLMKSAPFELFNWIIMLGWQKSSYFFYKTGNYRESIRRTNIIINSLYHIVEKEKMYVFWVSIVQQKLNLAKIYQRKYDLTKSSDIYQSAGELIARNPYKFAIEREIGADLCSKVIEFFLSEIESEEKQNKALKASGGAQIGIDSNVSKLSVY